MSDQKKKKEKPVIDEAAVDKIVEERKNEKNLKEQIYDKINEPIWALDIFIAVCVTALVFILIFKRTK